MAQVLKFFAWIAWGVVSTVIVVGILTALLFQGASSLDGAFSDPITIGILLGAYIPGGILYLLGALVARLNAREAAKLAANTGNTAEGEP